MQLLCWFVGLDKRTNRMRCVAAAHVPAAVVVVVVVLVLVLVVGLGVVVGLIHDRSMSSSWSEKVGDGTFMPTMASIPIEDNLGDLLKLTGVNPVPMLPISCPSPGVVAPPPLLPPDAPALLPLPLRLT